LIKDKGGGNGGSVDRVEAIKKEKREGGVPREWRKGEGKERMKLG
jgi:hypothetical protein